MSARASLDPASRTPVRSAWVGVDFARDSPVRSTRAWLPLLTLALLVALAIAALRIDLIRTRYALARAAERERILIEEQRRLIVRKRSLRGPTGLAALAQDRGFAPIERALSLPDPMPSPETPARGLGRAAERALDRLPPVAAAAADPGSSSP